jgi:hypothetical protein
MHNNDSVIASICINKELIKHRRRMAINIFYIKSEATLDADQDSLSLSIGKLQFYRHYESIYS